MASSFNKKVGEKKSLRQQTLSVLDNGSDMEPDEQYQMIAVSDLYEDQQIRTDMTDAGLQQLLNSMLNEGQIQPIVVCEKDINGHKIQKGHRRYRAATMSDGKITHLKCLVRKREGSKLEQLSENLVREDLDPFMTARALIEVKEEQNWNNKQLAKHYNFSESKLSAMMKCAEAPDAIKQAYSDGIISDVDTINVLRIALLTNESATLDFIHSNEAIKRSEAQAFSQSLKEKKSAVSAASETVLHSQESSNASDESIDDDNEDSNSLALDDTVNVANEPQHGKTTSNSVEKAPIKSSTKAGARYRIAIQLDGENGVIVDDADAESGCLVVELNNTPGQITVPVSDITLLGYVH